MTLSHPHPHPHPHPHIIVTVPVPDDLLVCMCGHVRASHAPERPYSCRAYVSMPDVICPCTEFEKRENDVQEEERA